MDSQNVMARLYVTLNNYLLLIGLILLIIPQTFCMNILFISVGAAGHLIPVFELAKAMNNHNITFLTQQLANNYINLTSYSSSSTFHVVYNNDSTDAFFAEKNLNEQLLALHIDHSLFDALPHTIPVFGRTFGSLLNKAIHILMGEHFDVIVSNSVITGVSILCQKSNIPCVIQSPASYSSLLDFNIPSTFSLLTTEDLMNIKGRLYNVAFNLRLITKIIHRLTMPLYEAFQYLPQIPGPFYDSFTLKNMLSSKSKCLYLVNVPPTFYVPTYSDHYKKYLGPFIDEKQTDDVENELTKWIKSKPTNSLIYAAFGSTTLIIHQRMFNLINGIAGFLLETPDSSALLAFRGANYDMYQRVLNELSNDEVKRFLSSNARIRVENGFVPQKWILQQSSVKIFLGHGGMGSTLEALYFKKPILCMPFSMDQFVNTMRIDNLGVGLSLFVPSSSLLQSLIHPYDFMNYIFSPSTVKEKLFALWTNISYELAAERMSMEMKHAGGLKQAIEEIEFFVNLNGNLDRFAPFPTTLSFHQRYMLDLLMILIIIPGTIITYLIVKCRRRRRKQKTE